MEYNIVNEIEFEVSEQQKQLFASIEKKVEEILDIKENYIFSIILVDSERIHEINRDYRGIDRATEPQWRTMAKGANMVIPIRDYRLFRYGNYFCFID